MSSLEEPIKIGTIEGKATPFGFTINLAMPITQTAFLSTIHEEKPSSYLYKMSGMIKKDPLPKFGSLENVPTTAFDFSCEVNFATPEEIQKASELNVSPEKALLLGMILNSEISATPDVEKLGRVFITGKSGSGKSYTVGVLIEELLKKQIPVVIIDRHGEYSALKILQPENIPTNDPYFSDPAHADGFNQEIIEFADLQMNPGADLGLEYLMACTPSDLVTKGQCSIINLRGLDIPIQEKIVNQQLMNLYKASTLQQIPPSFYLLMRRICSRVKSSLL